MRKWMLILIAALSVAPSARAQSPAAITKWMNENAITAIATPAEWRPWFNDLLQQTKRYHVVPAITDVEDLDVYVSEKSLFTMGEGFYRGTYAGVWLYDGIIVVSKQYLNNKGLVQHEMLHAILGAANFAAADGHPDIFRYLGLDAAWLKIGA